MAAERREQAESMPRRNAGEVTQAETTAAAAAAPTPAFGGVPIMEDQRPVSATLHVNSG